MDGKFVFYCITDMGFGAFVVPK